MKPQTPEAYKLAMTMLKKQIDSLKAKAEKKNEKAKEKAGRKFIKFKGEEIHNMEELFDMYQADMCTRREYDKARERLEKQLAGVQESVGGNTEEVAIQILKNIYQNLASELKELEFEAMSEDEQKKYWEDRFSQNKTLDKPLS